MRIFISDLSSTFASELVKLCQDADIEVLGTAPTKAQVNLIKRRLQGHPSSDTATAIREPVALHTDRHGCTKLLRQADIVITSLVNDTKHTMDLLKALEMHNNDQEDDNSGGGVKKFIALSSVLTWSKNAVYAKETSPNGPLGHQEDHFKTRKPTRKYAELKTAETQILSANRPDALETYVIGAGLLYGGAQSQFQLVFRNAWMFPTQDLLVPSIAGDTTKGGRNVVPMISVYDLALLTFKLAIAPAAQPKQYLLAVDKASQTTTLRHLCCGVSILLGNGVVRDIANEEEADALLLDEEDGLLAPLQLNLSFDTKEALMHELVAMDEWKHYDTGLLGNLAFYVDDFIQAMDLRALKTVVLGPPQVGKTMLSKRLAKQYYLPYISIESLASELFQSNDTSQQQLHQLEPSDGNSDGALALRTTGDDDIVNKLQEKFLEWKEGTKQLADIPEVAIVELLRWKLCSATCRNQGYVLDGVPLTLAQASAVFAPLPQQTQDGEDGTETLEGNDGDQPADPEMADDAEKASGDPAGDITDGNRSFAKSQSSVLLSRLRPHRQLQMPNRVIILDAPLSLLEKRAQSLTEEEAERSGNTQAAFETRFAEFTAQVEEIAQFFERKAPDNDDESQPTAAASEGVEVLELHLDSEEAFHNGDAFDGPIKTYMEQGGRMGKPPCNFHPTRAELRQMQREFELKKQEEEAKAREIAREQTEKEAADQQTRLAAEKARLEFIQREETELLKARAKPLRAYLMDTVLPALTEGMLEVVKVQPEDPIDYLAEFLFKKGKEMESS